MVWPDRFACTFFRCLGLPSSLTAVAAGWGGTIPGSTQVEVLKRLRSDPMNQGLRDALLISINGIAAGMRNTG